MLLPTDYWDESKIKVMIDEELLQEKIVQLAQQITDDYQGKTIHLLCILKGSVLFCADLMKSIKLPLEVSFMSLSSYGDQQESSGQVQFLSQLPPELKHQHILIVEDIVDSGLTLTKLTEVMHRELTPASLKIASLLFKPKKLKYPLNIDYLGFSIEDRFVIGYGLDYAQKYRNLPYIGVLE